MNLVFQIGRATPQLSISGFLDSGRLVEDAGTAALRLAQCSASLPLAAMGGRSVRRVREFAAAVIRMASDGRATAKPPRGFLKEGRVAGAR